MPRSGLRRAAAAVASMALAALVLSACSNGVTPVTIDVPPQVEGAFPEDVQGQLTSAVDFAMSATGSTGAVVGVWAPWSGSWVAGVGQASADDAFRIADVTRPMICDVLYRLVDARTVALDDEVAKYVPSVAGLTGVTLGQLCDGTSGLGSFAPRLHDQWISVPTRVWNPNELVAYGVGDAAGTQPGSTWKDSDAGYVLLGTALENATNRSAAELLREEVFAPLDLADTRLPAPRAAPAGDPVMRGFVSQPGEGGALNCTEPLDITTLSSSIGFTNAGVVSTISDLGRYAQALATGALVPGDRDRFASPFLVAADKPSWFTTKGGAYQAGSLIGQFGSIPGYLTAAFSDPGTGMTVAVTLNNSAASADAAAYLAWELAAIASKAPAASGQTAPEAGLPWTAQQYHDAIAALAVCPLPG